MNEVNKTSFDGIVALGLWFWQHTTKKEYLWRNGAAPVQIVW
jgi:hypothetical protein